MLTEAIKIIVECLCQPHRMQFSIKKQSLFICNLIIVHSMLLSFMITIMCDKYEVGVYERRLGYGKLWRALYLDEDGMDYFCE